MKKKKGKLLSQTYGDIIVVFFRDSRILDDTNISKIADELMEISDTRYKIKLLLNFQNVAYLSSTVLGKLVALHKKVKHDKGRLKLCDIKPSILEVFKITKLDKILSIHKTQQEAINAFKHKSWLRK